MLYIYFTCILIPQDIISVDFTVNIHFYFPKFLLSLMFFLHYIFISTWNNFLLLPENYLLMQVY